MKQKQQIFIAFTSSALFRGRRADETERARSLPHPNNTQPEPESSVQQSSQQQQR